jgi:hypothetical protein
MISTSPPTHTLNAGTGILWILGIIGVWFGILIGIHALFAL